MTAAHLTPLMAATAMIAVAWERGHTPNPAHIAAATGVDPAQVEALTYSGHVVYGRYMRMTADAGQPKPPLDVNARRGIAVDLLRDALAEGGPVDLELIAELAELPAEHVHDRLVEMCRARHLPIPPTVGNVAEAVAVPTPTPVQAPITGHPGPSPRLDRVLQVGPPPPTGWRFLLDLAADVVAHGWRT